MKRILYLALGGLTFALGTLGIFVPFLPTTVFYLLTGFFWLRSSTKLYQGFINSAKYQQYVQHPLIEKNITNRGMFRMFGMILFVFAIPWLLVDNFVMRISLIVIYLAHVIGLTIYLKGKKAVKKNPREEIGS